MSNKEDYWFQKVDKLMSDRKKVNELLKDKNYQIRKANDENHKLSQDLKHSLSLIDEFELNKMVAKHRANGRLSNVHFQEVSDIISEEDSLGGTGLHN